MADKIFISYRRGDDPGNTGRLFDRLLVAFARSQLFMDVDSITPGDDFVRVLEATLVECDVLLAIIGRGWITARDRKRNRRLDNPRDFVRIEIATALKRDKRVIPVLVGEARMPIEDELPEGIKSLAHRHAVRLTHERFQADADGLIKAIQQILKEAENARRKKLFLDAADGKSVLTTQNEEDVHAGAEDIATTLTGPVNRKRHLARWSVGACQNLVSLNLTRRQITSVRF